MNEPRDFQQLVDICQRTNEEMRLRAAKAVDLSLVVRNWLFGCHIVEFENGGAERSALYGKKLISQLSARLRQGGIKGVSPTNLRKFREFYLAYPEIQQTVSVKSNNPEKIQQTVSVESLSSAASRQQTSIWIPASLTRRFTPEVDRQAAGELQAHDKAHEPMNDTELEMLRRCSPGPASTPELLDALEYQSRPHNFKKAVARLLAVGSLEMTIPDNPRSKKQKYRLTDKGRTVIQAEAEKVAGHPKQTGIKT
jgi:hypothetical protein